MRMGLYARVSTQDQQTLALQRDAMAAYVAQQEGNCDHTSFRVSEQQKESIWRIFCPFYAVFLDEHKNVRVP